MPRRLSVIDRGRAAESAALLCSAVFAALALWLLVRLVWLLVPRSDAALETAPARGAAVASGAVPAQSVAKWHLFGNTPRKPGQGVSAPVTTLSLVLRGTVADADPRNGFAVVSDPQNGERTFRVGEEVASGARLSGVYPDHIVLVHEGVEEILKLPRDRNLLPADVVRATPGTASSRGVANPLAAGGAAGMAPGAASAGGAANVTSTTPLQQTIEQLRQNPDELAKRVQIVPVLDGGKLTGVRISAAGDAALMNQLGLRPGDVVTQVNGLPVDSFARGEQIMTSLKTSTAVRVTVQRDGKPTDITVGLK